MVAFSNSQRAGAHAALETEICGHRRFSVLDLGARERLRELVIDALDEQYCANPEKYALASDPFSDARLVLEDDVFHRAKCKIRTCGNFGFVIETFLILLALNILVKVIVNWLFDDKANQPQ